jgi:hypothetical protein
MRSAYLVAAAASLVFHPYSLHCASTFTLPAVDVGSSLETSASIRTSAPAPASGLDITLRSSDPARLLFSNKQDQPGSASIVVKVRPGFSESLDFWVQGFGNPGIANYTVGAPDYDTGTGTVTVSPSAVIIRGPWGSAPFVTTPQAEPSNITVLSVRLDSSRKVAQEQYIAGGFSVRIDVNSSNPAAGTISKPELEIAGGTNMAATMFRPAGEGDSTLSLRTWGNPVSLFTVPVEFTEVTAKVQKPGLGMSDGLAIGKNLQLGGVLALGQPAPEGGLEVTLESEDPTRLLISDSSTAVGKKSITLKLGAGKFSKGYSLQALGGSGKVTYTASAPGYRGRTATVTLTPSGAVITLASQGPPDEAHILRNEKAEPITPSFIAGLTPPSPTRLVVWTLQLHPVTLRGADVTTQALRPGFSVTIPLTSSNPAVGTIVPSVVIQPGSDHAVADFVPVAVGSTEISVNTPPSFATSANSTKLIAIVQK